MMKKYQTIIKESIDDIKWEDVDIIRMSDGTEIDMQKLLDEQSRAKTALNHLMPVLGGFVGRLQFVYTFKVSTQATDGFNIFVNPQFTAKLNLTEKVFVMAHEVMHCLLNHMRRGKGHDPKKSNIAADYEVNDTLVEMDLFKESTVTNIGALYDKKYVGWGYEKIYADNPSDPSNQSMDNSDNFPKNPSDPSNQSMDNSPKNPGNNRSQDGGKTGQPTQEDFNSPSGLSDVPGRAGGMISREDGKKIAESEGYKDNGPNGDRLAEEWAEVAKKAAMKGDMPGNLKSKIENLYKTSHNWKKELKRIVGHSISMSDKRQAYANKNVLASQNRVARTDKDKYDSLDYMMVWVDSSGSMSDDMLRRVLTEVYAVALTKKPIKLYVVQCDTKIRDIKEYRNLKDLNHDLKVATVKGRGGTELKPCWDLLKNDPRFKRVRSELIMIFTDGYLTQYKRDIKHMNNLCWCILNNSGWNVQYKDAKTMAVHLATEDMK